MRAAEPDADAIAAVTQRAVIVTAAALIDDQPGIVYRYFAPQYGDLEDAATGSAAVQLAAYWQPRMASTSFPAQQLSATGAEVQLTCNERMVELAARVGYG